MFSSWLPFVSFCSAYDDVLSHFIHLVSMPALLWYTSCFWMFLHAGPHQIPALTDPPTTVNHDSTYLPPLSAPGPAEAGGIMPEPGSASSPVQGGSFTLPKVSTANGPAGSVSEAPLMDKPRRILSFFVSCLVFYLQLWITMWRVLCCTSRSVVNWKPRLGWQVRGMMTAMLLKRQWLSLPRVLTLFRKQLCLSSISEDVSL